MITNAILLAAGFGTRLRPLTDTLPKCLMPVGVGVPLLGFWIKKLANAGVRQIYINSHFLDYMVEEYLEYLRPLVEANLIEIKETDLLGTMGTVRHIVTTYDVHETLVMHCDNYTAFDITNILAAPVEFPVSVAGFYSGTSDSVGRLIVDKSSRQIVRWIEKDPTQGAGWASNAIYTFRQSAISHIAQTSGSDLVNDWLIPESIQSRNCPAGIIYNTTANIDIGTETALRAAQKQLCKTDFTGFIPAIGTCGWVENFFAIKQELVS